jgi:hypothetical protein
MKTSKAKTTKVKIDYPLFKIVANGGLSDPFRGEGRIYPALVLDIRDNFEVKELFKLHKETPPGDTKLIWGRPNTFFKPKTVVLILEFIKPMRISFGIEFDIKTQYALADGVIQQRGVILVSGKRGNKIAELINESIVVEVPNLDFDQTWNNILQVTLNDKYRKMGASRNDIKGYINEHIKSMREFWNIRREEK